MRSGNLINHGGPVQLSTHRTYAIFWGPVGGFSNSYQSNIGKYFGNVAADSGKSSNVYFSDTQYYTGASKITYSEAFGGSYADTSTPANGCSSRAGGSICVTDLQVQQEISKVRGLKGWPAGMNAEFFVFLANGLSTCVGGACAFSTFCAYHSNFVSGNQQVLYSNMPYTAHNLNACGSGQSPSGDAATDSTLNVTSHEANETITDPLGNAWFDRNGNENGDKCAWNFGSPLGTNLGSAYNQRIGTGVYYLQGEWSNGSSKCVWSGL